MACNRSLQKPLPTFLSLGIIQTFLSKQPQEVFEVQKVPQGTHRLPRMYVRPQRLGFDDRPLTVWTSTLKRTIATARHLPAHYNQLQWKALDELDGGVCDGLTYAEIEQQYPEDFAARDADKYYYRYRGGESYRDVVTRLEPIIMELERSENILIITHQAVVRCIYAYFMQKSQEESPWMKVPLHTLIKLTPRAYGTEEIRYSAGIGAVSTYRTKGSVAKHEDGTDMEGKMTPPETKTTPTEENGPEAPVANLASLTLSESISEPKETSPGM